MINVAGYEIVDELYANERTRVYHAIRLSDQLPVALKTLNAEYPPQEAIARLKYEYNLLKNLNVAGVIRAYGFEKIGYRYVLILEHIENSMTLSTFLQNQSYNLDLFLSILLQVTYILRDLHAAHIIHKDINPDNILINKDTHQIKLLDFSISTQLIQENQEIQNVDKLEGTLPYLSPEQTGRMNHPIDRRSDFYALGIVFYQMLTGQLPFEAKDPLEWVHLHIAKHPLPPKKLNSAIPDLISAVVMKLLEKSCENRYATAHGLIVDLERFRDALQNENKDLYFPLGESDHTGLFQISQKLYGREKEVTQLLTAFEKVCQGTREFLLVQGHPGIGKTALINEIHKLIVRQHGYFSAGKFEQFQQTIPYFALIQAFRQLIRQLLTESPQRIDMWKEKLLKRLTPNAKVIIDVIPEVAWLIGEQPPVLSLPPLEARNRFESVFTDFLQVFAHEKHPLVIFLDDLQWADLSSLTLIKRLLQDITLNHFLLIGAYRDNEVTSNHPLLDNLNDLIKLDVPLEKIEVNPLSEASVTQLIADTLNTTHTITPLANLILQKTGGNPFFVNTFLTMLYKENYLTFNHGTSEWTWDIDILQGLIVTDNVVTLLVNKIKKLEANVQELLKIAGCIGNQFNLKLLALISEKSLSETAVLLWPLLQENFIIPLSSDYQLIMADSDYIEKNILYKFSHDRVQQAALSMLQEDQYQTIHLKLARLTLKNLTQEELTDSLFVCVNYFNASLNLLTYTSERIVVATLNLKAGNKAKASSAFESAANYFKYAIDLLGENGWETHYSTILDASMGYAECLYASTQFAKADKQFAYLFDKAKSNVDKVHVLMLQATSAGAQSKWEESIDAGLQALQLLGLKLKKKPNVLKIALELLTVRWLLRKNKAENLLRLPILPTSEKTLLPQCFALLIESTYFINHHLHAILTLKAIRYILQYGLFAPLVIEFAAYGAMLIVAFRDYEQAIKLSQVSLQLSEKFEDQSLKVKTYVGIANSILPWKLTYRECHEKLHQAYLLGRQTGVIMHVCFAAAAIPQMMWAQGDDLASIVAKLKQVSSIPEIRGNDEMLLAIDTMKIMLPVLQGTKPTAHFHQRVQDHINHTIPDVQPTVYGVNGLLALAGTYLLEKWDMALQLTHLMRYYAKLPVLTCIFQSVDYFFYSALVLLHCYETATTWQKFRYRLEIKSDLNRLKKWATLCPANCAAKHYLVLGGWFQINHQWKNALITYNKAIAAAHEYNLTQIEAIANESVGRMLHTHQLFEFSKHFFQAAYLIYKHWGAEKKCQLLEAQFPELQLTQKNQPIKTATLHATMSSTYTATDISLDMLAVLKLSQAISSEIHLNKLLQKLLHIVVEDAGAQRIMMLINERGQWMIEAEGTVEEQKIYLEEMQIASAKHVPLQLIQYAERCKEPVILQDTTKKIGTTVDAYLQREKPKSALLLPILYQNKVRRILYLENKSTANVFTPERLQHLQLITSQAAISLENADLFRQSTHDSLTGLANRVLLEQIFTHASAQRSTKIAIIFFDLDYFKLINDTYGHEVGDEVLIYVAKQFKLSLREGDLAVRLGGDEFVAILTNINDMPTVHTIIKRIYQLVTTSIKIKECDITVSISMGVSLYPQDGEDIHTLLKNADVALYKAKEKGRNNYQLYSIASRE